MRSVAFSSVQLFSLSSFLPPSYLFLPPATATATAPAAPLSQPCSLSERTPASPGPPASLGRRSSPDHPSPVHLPLGPLPTTSPSPPPPPLDASTALRPLSRKSGGSTTPRLRTMAKTASLPSRTTMPRSHFLKQNHPNPQKNGPSLSPQNRT